MVETIDWRKDFDFPELGIKFHCWDKEESNSSGFYIDPHSHNHYEFLIITKGSTMHYYNKVYTQINVGDVFLIKPGDIHGFKQIKNEHCTHINIAINTETLKKLCDILSPDIFNFINSSKQTKFNLKLEEFEFLKYLSNFTLKNSIEDKVNYSMLLKNIVINLITQFKKFNIKENDQYPEWFAELLFKLHNHEYLDISANDVYKFSKYSPAMANKYFKEYTGMTVNKYLQHIKINYAKNALISTNYTTLVISMQIGFDSLSYFNKLFKKETGLTPQEYRINYKKKNS